MLSTDEAAAIASTPSHSSVVPQPHPNLSRTPSVSPPSSSSPDWPQSTILSRGEHTEEILSELGLSVRERARLREEGALGQSARAKL